ncbi:dihydrolipoyllysine-residue succinyltransferase [Buchnera aphidicola (Ceratoglyphina bambusae)]|uniref:dihydrolipoyllysine-residue succinyltransferase n=1 Tax=Buchnera aphidicola TaxID=9 RepID=UPI0031B85A62
MNHNIINIFAPEFPESVTNSTIIRWNKKIGDEIKYNEIILEIETDKIIMSVYSPVNGILNNIYKIKGEKILSKEILGNIKKKIKNENIKNKDIKTTKNYEIKRSPSVRRLIKTKNLTTEEINEINEKDRITKYEVLKFLNKKKKNEKKKNKKKDNIKKTKTNKKKYYLAPMSALRKSISKRLQEAKNNSVMLTTFNEVNMEEIIKIRKKYSIEFENKHKIKLGFMSFFIKSVIESLKEFPEVNTSIHKENIKYYNCYNINIAISTDRGLVAPLIKNADLMSMQKIEKKIIELKKKSENGNLKIKEMKSGSFTISNGGVFGSLLSTPIINPPQTAILGINSIQNRPVAINNKIKIKPMMYLSLSYDHRLIDGKSSISFLKHIKNMLEDFSRVMLNV